MWYDLRVACAGGPPGLQDDSDEAPGGVLVLDAFFDNDLQIRCDFVQTEGGGWHCLPEHFGLYVTFTDSTCTEYLYEGVVGGSAWKSTDGECGEGHLVPVDLGEQVSLAGAPLFYPADAECLESSGSWPGMMAFEGTERPLAEFVEGTPHVAESGGAYASVLVGEDGSRFVLHASDADAQLCNVQATDSGLRCIPFTGASTSGVADHFGDAACTEPLGAMNNASCDHRIALDWDPSNFVTARPILATLPNGEAFTLRNGNCVRDPISDERAALVLGPPIPSTAWPATRTTTRGTGPIRQSWVVSQAGTPLAPDRYTETLMANGEPCEVTLLDGEPVCVPFALPLVDVALYADAACTVPLASSPSEVIIDWPQADIHTVATAAYAAGAAHTGPLWERSSTQGCTPVDEPAFSLVPFAPAAFTRVDL